MKGELVFRTRYYAREGHRDLFGNDAFEDVSKNGFIGFSGPSYYMRGARLPIAAANAVESGLEITRGGFSRYRYLARFSDVRLTLYPALNINKAVSVLAAINFGGFRNRFARSRHDGTFALVNGGTSVMFTNLMPGVPPYERYFMLGSGDGAYNTASLMSVEQLKGIVVFPIVTWAVGIKNFPIGTGATYARNTREESVYAVVPYGPLSFHAYYFLTPPTGERFPNEFFRFLDIPGRWSVSGDSTLQSQAFMGLVTQYHSGNIELGLGGFYHEDRIEWQALGRDAISWFQQWRQGLAWVKYNNGRFFMNGETAVEIADLKGDGIVGGVSLAPKYDLFGYHAFVETGVVIGPMKLSLMWARSSGRSLTTQDTLRTRSHVVPINYQALEPYNYLMFMTYAGGNNQFNRDGTGEMGDAITYAFRLDHALAANLNLFAAYIWAHRLEKNGYFAGAFGTADEFRLAGIPPGTDGMPIHYGYGTPGSTTGADAQVWKSQNTGVPAAGLNPFVDNGFIGWEVNLGTSWRLLESVTWNAIVARWQPGEWFDQAYRVFSATPQGLVGNGLMNGRDPIYAFYMDMTLDF
jgi:hypothetical protein